MALEEGLKEVKKVSLVWLEKPLRKQDYEPKRMIGLMFVRLKHPKKLWIFMLSYTKESHTMPQPLLMKRLAGSM